MVKLTWFLLPLAAAFPFADPEAQPNIKPRGPQPSKPLIGKTGRPNTGLPPLGFDEKGQFVDVSPGSAHEFRRPGPGDLRGQCPGLNALANHGFFPRNGILTPADTVKGLTEGYNMDATQAFILSIFSIAISGDIPSTRWSIGGAFPASIPLLAEPQGILGTHNEYEGDASVLSGDAYLNGGKVGVFRQTAADDVYRIGQRDGGYNMDNLAEHNLNIIKESIATNPYYFSSPLSGFIVTPAAHNFVIAFMSNHTKEIPGGYLDWDIFSSFFGITGSEGNWKFDYGSQQIPQNWYKMPFLNSYTIAQTAGDAVINGLTTPGVGKLGGNVNGVNSFVGLDTGDLTGGVYNAGNLAEGNNAICFAMQFTMAAKLDQANVFGFLREQLNGVMGDLACPDVDLTTFKMSMLDKYPGYKYKAQGQKK